MTGRRGGRRGLPLLAVLVSGSLFVFAGCGASARQKTTSATTTDRPRPAAVPPPAPTSRLPTTTTTPAPAIGPDGKPIPCGVSTDTYGVYPAASAPATAQTPSAADLAAFTAAYTVFVQAPAGTVSMVPGSARLAFIPSEGYSWGYARFAAGPGQPESVTERVAPPYDQLAFVQPPHCPWAYHGPIATVFPCPAFQELPVGVARAWGLPQPTDAECSRAYVPPAPR